MHKQTICKRCIIDNIVYPDITFDKNGICDICNIFDNWNKTNQKLSDAQKHNALQNQINEIKKVSKKNEYDCILGLSGGVDSSYLALLAKDWGLNPLLVHIDNCWNSEFAVSNIEKVIDYTGFDLYTYVVHWKEIRDLDLAFLYASVVDTDLPNEMPFVAMLYKLAKKFKVKHILTGYNNNSEGWMPPNVTHYKLDTLNIRAIHKKFGKVKLKTYPTIGPFMVFYFEQILGIHYINPLDLINFNKNTAKLILQEKIKWNDYGDKHCENIFTRFYQSYILPTKFNIDKRKFHLSSLICSGQISRDKALSIIKNPVYSNSFLFNEDFEFFLKKLKLSEKDFMHIMNTPIKKHTDYPSYINYYNFFKPIYKPIKNMFRKIRII